MGSNRVFNSFIKFGVLVAGLVLFGCSGHISANAGNASVDFPVPINIANSEKDFAAHWIRPDVILLKDKTLQAWLVSSESAELDDIQSVGQGFSLQPMGMPEWIVLKYPHLQAFHPYRVSLPSAQIKSLLKQQLAVISVSPFSSTHKFSYVQHYGVLDALYTNGHSDADELAYGALVKDKEVQFRVWAPTAIEVAVNLYADDKSLIASLPMQEDSGSGAWSISTDKARMGTYYKYQVKVYHHESKKLETLEVTDPYSLSLSRNSLYSQVINLDDPVTAPKGWFTQHVPAISHPEAHIIYETHIRDFSAWDSGLSSPNNAGKYKAFGESQSDGVKHLGRLREAGLNTIHLLPTFDISTVNEDPDKAIYLQDELSKVCKLLPTAQLCNDYSEHSKTLLSILDNMDPMTGDAQAIIEQIRPYDAYNWGYDPFHYTVPEGSYALDPEGIPRVKEFREMILSLHGMGFRVVMDVVYNHTFKSGLNAKSVLDKIVPQYYHRLHPVTGAVEQSTCCDNTATEHRMMAKLMNDSLVVWAKDYSIDGFRFDLMGHQPKAAMLEARKIVESIDADTYFYGEGWNFGEVANNAQFIQASQIELAGSEIGTYTDRLRDAVRGGSSFVFKEALREGQGIGNGLVTVPNDLQTQIEKKALWHEYNLSMDQLRVGLAGNLASFPLINSDGNPVTGKGVDYGGAPTGYAKDPADTINYVSKHDNQTLWDNNQYRIAYDASTEERVDMQILSLAYPLLSQGIPFLHMGGELLRSKSFLRDSFDFNDWFNRVDFSMHTNNYHVGLPPAEKDGDNWGIIRRVIAGNEGRDLVSKQHIQNSASRFLELLKIRSTSLLFSLPTASDVIKRVKFHNVGVNQKAGLIAMSITDNGQVENIDKNFKEILVIFNNSREAKILTIPNISEYRMHPVLQQGIESELKEITLESGGIRVPGLKVAVLVIPEHR